MNAAVKNIIREELRDLFTEDFVQERQTAVNEERERVAVDMLRENLPVTLIEKISKLPETTIRSIYRYRSIKTHREKQTTSYAGGPDV